jgi:hypothetical protein
VCVTACGRGPLTGAGAVAYLCAMRATQACELVADIVLNGLTACENKVARASWSSCSGGASDDATDSRGHLSIATARRDG